MSKLCRKQTLTTQFSSLLHLIYFCSLKIVPLLLSFFPDFTIIAFAAFAGVIFHFIPRFKAIRISTDAHPAEALARDIFKFRLPYKQLLKKNCYLCTFKDRLITSGDSFGKHRFSCLRQRKSASDAGFRESTKLSS